MFEATSRIAKQTHLTRLWSPEHVGWTAINLVEAMNKEKLLYLHCPELREYLKTRPNRNTYEYMGTSAQTHPEDTRWRGSSPTQTRIWPTPAWVTRGETSTSTRRPWNNTICSACTILRAVIMSLMSAVRFGANPLSFAIPTAMHAMAKRRPTKSTGIFDRNGMIDQARLGEYQAALRELAQKSDDGHVSKDAFMELLRERGALGLTTRNQWGSFFRLMKRLHGRETITVDAFDKLYSGKLLIEAFEQFAPEEIKAKPAPRPPELAQTASSPPGHTHRPNNELVDEQAKRSNLPKPPLPKGAFIGKSSTLSGRDRMSLQLRPDPSNAQCYFAILSEYTRQRPPLPSFLPDRLQITNWVPRMHAYHVDYAGDNQFQMPLCVGPDGNLVPDRNVPASGLHIGSDGMREASLGLPAANATESKKQTVDLIMLMGLSSHCCARFFSRRTDKTF